MDGFGDSFVPEAEAPAAPEAPAAEEPAAEAAAEAAVDPAAEFLAREQDTLAELEDAPAAAEPPAMNGFADEGLSEVTAEAQEPAPVLNGGANYDILADEIQGISEAVPESMPEDNFFEGAESGIKEDIIFDNPTEIREDLIFDNPTEIKEDLIFDTAPEIKEDISVDVCTTAVKDRIFDARLSPVPVREEPEKIRLWREQQKTRLEEKDAAEAVAMEQLRQKAAEELAEWYTAHEETLAKTRQANRSAEKELVADTAALEPGTEWERITKLCDFNPKTAKSTRDVSRMRSIILQVKQSPPTKA